MAILVRHDFFADAFARRARTKKIGRAVTSLPTDQLTSFVKTYSFSLGGSLGWRSFFARTLIDWIEQSASHRDTTTALADRTSHGALPRTVGGLLSASQLTGALGLHLASFTFEQHARDLIVSRERAAKHSVDLLRLVQTAIYEGDLEHAVAVAKRLRERLGPRRSTLDSYRNLWAYLAIWSGKVADNLEVEPASRLHRWQGYVRDQRINIYGPGVVPPECSSIPPDEKVVRIAGPGAYKWSNSRDLAMGRTNIVYVNPETLSSIGKSDEDRIAIFGGYDFVRVKKASANYLPNALRVDTASRLFLRGHPNMVPLICLDTCRVPGTLVRVFGSDFFASPIAYREDSRRSVGEGQRQDVQGSTGRPYDRSTLMASHNVFENREVVRNLYLAGKISGDSSFSAALEMSSQRYAETLDRIYGETRS